MTSQSRNGGSSSEGKDLEVESMGSFVFCSSQWGFMGGGQWRMMTACLMVAVDEHASLLLCLSQVGVSIDLVRSKVLPV